MKDLHLPGSASSSSASPACSEPRLSASSASQTAESCAGAPCVGLPRFYVEKLPVEGGIVPLDDTAAHHLRVLRLEPGAALQLFDASGYVAEAALLAPGDPSNRAAQPQPRQEGKARRGKVGLRESSAKEEKKSESRVTAMPAWWAHAGPARSSRADMPRVTLVQVMPKGSKIDAIVRMVTEIGVAQLLLVESKHSVARLHESAHAGKQARLEAIAREATRQSRGARMPGIALGGTLCDVTSKAPATANRLVCWERSEEPIFPMLCAIDPQVETWIVVGAEGGLHAEEVQTLHRQSYVDVSLGRSILRVETAAPVACGLLVQALWARAHHGRPSSADT